MFDGEEVTHAVVLITDGHEIYAIPVQRTGDLTWETKQGFRAEKLQSNTFAAVAVSIDGAEVCD